MKAILLSVKPKELVDILNGKQNVIIRKKFPKDYVGWVYLYCTKGNKHNKLWLSEAFGYILSEDSSIFNKTGCGHYNGKVVARAWCDNVEEIATKIWTPTKEREILSACCLTENELFDYIDESKGKPFNVVHIAKLEIFDTPKRLYEFEKNGSYKRKDVKCPNKDTNKCNKAISPYTKKYCGCDKARITLAPKNYCYVDAFE